MWFLRGGASFGFLGGILGLLVGLAVGIYYIVIATTGTEYSGTLISAGRDWESNNDDGGGGYYVKEVFRKDDTNNTCYVLRQHSYRTVHAVNHAKDRVILGTQRTIWAYWHNHDKCYDEQIQIYNIVIGSVILGFFVVIPIVALCMLFPYFRYSRNLTREANELNNDDDETDQVRRNRELEEEQERRMNNSRLQEVEMTNKSYDMVETRDGDQARV
jgi:ABC-type antimicrobial peptide transport system permease subunit